jgi:hypothetical protein
MWFRSVAYSALRLRLRAGLRREEGSFSGFLFTALKGRSSTNFLSFFA